MFADFGFSLCFERAHFTQASPERHRYQFFAALSEANNGCERGMKAGLRGSIGRVVRLRKLDNFPG